MELYKIIDGQDERYFFSADCVSALNHYKENYFYDDPKVERVLTDQGYPITRLRDVPKGLYFHRVSVKDGEYCEHSVVWCKGEYDRSTKKWLCHKFEDVNHSRLFKGEERVTVDFTF